jgi:hypothetical protein
VKQQKEGTERALKEMSNHAKDIKLALQRLPTLTATEEGATGQALLKQACMMLSLMFAEEKERAETPVDTCLLPLDVSPDAALWSSAKSLMDRVMGPRTAPRAK